MKNLTLMSVLFVSLLMSKAAHAGWLAYEGTIDMLASSIGPQFNSPANSPDRFSVKVNGGSVGTCHGPWIVFEKSYFSSNPEAYQRAFSVALMAYTTGTKVKIHNLNSDSCNGATSIQIVK